MPKALPISRLTQISKILLKHGFRYAFGKKRITADDAHGTRLYRRVRLVLEELGPTFIKFGQILGNRVDLLPAGMIHELQLLQYRVQPFSPDLALSLVEKEWNRDWQKVLTYWDPNPSAAASISQVHRARLHDGRDVAVKVQRPDAEKTIKQDIVLMYRIADFFRFFIRSEVIDPKQLIKEFEQTILAELDFQTEMRSLARLSSILNATADVRVPSPHPALSTSRVLVMDWVNGTHPSSPQEIELLGMNPESFLQKLSQSYLRQIFIHGFFHADPHPGNILITPDKTIYLLDAGQTGILYKKQRDLLTEFAVGLATGDRLLIVQTIWELCSPVDEYPSAQFEQELGRTVESFLEIPLKDLNLIHFLTAVIDLFHHHHLGIPTQFYALLKTLINLDSLALRFDPNFQIVDWLGKNLFSLVFNAQNTRDSIFQGLGSLYESYKLLKNLPADLRGVLKTFKSGRVQFSLNERNLSKTMVELGKISNRLSASLIITGLILAGTVLIQTPSQPTLFGIPILAAPLFGGAILMGLWLLWSIWRSRTF